MRARGGHTMRSSHGRSPARPEPRPSRRLTMTQGTAPSAHEYDVGTESLASSGRWRSQALADRLEQGARALGALASSLTPAEWATRIPGDGRSVGTIVHHVASMYPIEMQLAVTLASGRPITGLTWADVHALNQKHAAEHETVTVEAALELLRGNS